MFIFRHSLWTDEAQAFILARDSHSFTELIYNLRYEGHPPLWHTLLFLLTRITPAFEAMQVLHLLLAGITVYLVTRFAPFPTLAKILFPFGYFPLFEYGIISRNYQIVLLLACLFCILWLKNRTAYIRLSLILIALCLSHVMGVILAAAFGMMLLLDAIITPVGRIAIRGSPIRFSLALILVIAGAALAVIALKPPPDYGYAIGWSFRLEMPHLTQTLAVMQDGLLPITQWMVHFWHSRLDEPYYAICGPILALMGLFLVRNSWRATLIYLVSVLGQCTFSYIKFTGSIRHHGSLFITLIAAVWIAWGSLPSFSSDASRFGKLLYRTPRVLFTLFLAAQLFSAFVALYFCWQVSFTVNRAAGLALQAALKPDDLLVADCEFVAPSLAVYIPGRIFEFPSTQRSGTFILWEKDGSWRTSGLRVAMEIAKKQNRFVVWVTRDARAQLPKGVTPIGIFPSHGDTLKDARAIVNMEQFAIYRISPSP